MPITHTHQLYAYNLDSKGIDKLFEFSEKELSLWLLRFIKTKSHQHGLLDHLGFLSYFKHRLESKKQTEKSGKPSHKKE